VTDLSIVQTALRDHDAGTELGMKIVAQIGGAPDAVIVFSSPANNHSSLLRTLVETTGTKVLVGCSSAGEYTADASGEGLTCAVALRAADMRFAASVGRTISTNYRKAADDLANGFDGDVVNEFRHHTALILIDALAGHTENFVEALTVATAGTYRFFGGGAGDDARFQSTKVFCGTEVYSDAAVGLEILSDKPFGIGARHGWCPVGAPLRVTESEQSSILSLNVAPAVEAFADHAEATNQRFDPADPMPFFLHNIVGIETDTGHKLRVPLGLTGDGGVVCAADVPMGATAHIMRIEKPAAAEAAVDAARDAMQQVESEGFRPKGVLFFDCVATRLRLGQEFGSELDALSTEIGGIPFAGFNSYGQVVRSQGQFSGFHNCTAVVCVIPE
jgi:hypothetical protein